jgi:hypothetical protein
VFGAFFGQRYFGDRYFGQGGTAVAETGDHFGNRYFGATYFGARYFGGAPGEVEPPLPTPEPLAARGSTAGIRGRGRRRRIYLPEPDDEVFETIIEETPPLPMVQPAEVPIRRSAARRRREERLLLALGRLKH